MGVCSHCGRPIPEGVVGCLACGAGPEATLPVFGDAPEPVPYAPSTYQAPPPVYLPTRPRPETTALSRTGSSACLIIMLLGLAFALAAAASIMAAWLSYLHPGMP